MKPTKIKITLPEEVANALTFAHTSISAALEEFNHRAGDLSELEAEHAKLDQSIQAAEPDLDHRDRAAIRRQEEDRIALRILGSKIETRRAALGPQEAGLRALIEEHEAILRTGLWNAVESARAEAMKGMRPYYNDALSLKNAASASGLVQTASHFAQNIVRGDRFDVVARRFLNAGENALKGIVEIPFTPVIDSDLAAGAV